MFVRQFNDYSLFTADKLKAIHETGYDKPYDINLLDWIGALFRKDIHPQKTSRFWCSALVGFVLTKVGILAPETDWSIMRPCDFALDGERLNYIGDVRLKDIESLIASAKDIFYEP